VVEVEIDRLGTLRNVVR